MHFFCVCIIQVFDNVQRLSEAFIALYTAGNPLFRQWEAQISCCTNTNDPSIMMDFHRRCFQCKVLLRAALRNSFQSFVGELRNVLNSGWILWINKDHSTTISITTQLNRLYTYVITSLNKMCPV
ncbi:hypothetical protein NQD34_018520 [Periophthalmus magnuspinnatus]|nr:hypothetical protein NQD34_018520 [Periophthalmus magnuspinnatus]